MIIYFLILTIFFLISFIFFLLIFSNIEIEINKLYFDSNNIEKDKLETYLFYIRLKLLSKITWFKIKIDSNKIRNSKIIKNKILPKLSNKDLLKNNKEILKIKNIEKLDIKIEKLDLDIKVSLSDSIITAFSVVIITTIISIVLARKIDEYNKNKYIYIVSPVYKNKPTFKVKLNCIIDIKIVHIINVIYMLIKKKRSVKYDERTSNRKSYVRSNE